MPAISSCARLALNSLKRIPAQSAALLTSHPPYLSQVSHRLSEFKLRLVLSYVRQLGPYRCFWKDRRWQNKLYQLRGSG